MLKQCTTGGSIDSRLWGKPRESVSWAERICWAKDAAEVRASQLCTAAVER